MTSSLTGISKRLAVIPREQWGTAGYTAETEATQACTNFTNADLPSPRDYRLFDLGHTIILAIIALGGPRSVKERMRLRGQEISRARGAKNSSHT